MNKVLIILFFAFNYTFGQSYQHEPRKLFVITLNVPQNTRNTNDAYTEFALKNNLKQLLCLRDGQISSEINFDKKGYVISKIENDNTIVNKSEFQYDNNGRIIKISYYSPNGDFKYGYEYDYQKDTKLTYENPGKTLKTKVKFNENKSQKTSTDFGPNQEIVSRKIEIFDENRELKLKQEFSKNKLNREFVYYSKDGEKFEDEILYLENGKKIIETTKMKDYDVRDVYGNTITNYFGDFKVSEHKFNKANRLISSDFYSKKKGHWKTEINEYNNETILILNTQNYPLTNQIKSYQFIYDSNGYLKQVIKTKDSEKHIFEYKYKFYE